MRILLVLCFCLAFVPAFAAPPAKVSPEDALFQALAKAPSAEAAAPIEKQLLAGFLHSGSDSVDLLMDRAAQCLAANDQATATELVNRVTQIDPRYAEGWHERARLEAAAGDDRAAIDSLRNTLALNARQFAAYAELADLLDDYGDKAGALAMYRKAFAIDPHYDDVAVRVRELTRAVEGQGI